MHIAEQEKATLTAAGITGNTCFRIFILIFISSVVNNLSFLLTSY